MPLAQIKKKKRERQIIPAAKDQTLASHRKHAYLQQKNTKQRYEKNKSERGEKILRTEDEHAYHTFWYNEFGLRNRNTSSLSILRWFCGSGVVTSQTTEKYHKLSRQSFNLGIVSIYLCIDTTYYFCELVFVLM